MGQLELIASTPTHRQANTHTHTNTHTYTHTHTHTHTRARINFHIHNNAVSLTFKSSQNIHRKKITGIIHTTLTKYCIPYPREKKRKKKMDIVSHHN